MNSYYFTNVSNDSISEQIKSSYPHIDVNKLDPLFKVEVYQCIFNLNINFTMLDYGSLLLPTFRSLDFILHRILGDDLHLKTDSNGRNFFYYFNKDKNCKYYYSCKKSSLNDKTKEDLLNDVYNFYNQTRHAVCHWSYVDRNNVLITSFDDAKNNIEKGLHFLDEYYRLFVL